VLLQRGFLSATHEAAVRAGRAAGALEGGARGVKASLKQRVREGAGPKWVAAVIAIPMLE
jgi:hypothetical protein